MLYFKRGDFVLIVDKQKNIKLSRGDYAEICFNLKKPDNTDYILSEGEKVEFAVKINANNTNKLISKILSNPGESYVTVVLEKTDTQNLTFGQYFYDIRVIGADNKINTPMLKAKFEILEVIGNGSPTTNGSN